MGSNDYITQTVNRIRPKRHLLWLVAFLWWCSHLHAADTPPAGSQKLQRLMEQVRAAKSATSATATDSNSISNTATAANVPPAQARMQERALLLARGEAALARNDTDAAQTAFESAAAILHAADTEMGIVRTYMQQAQYRRALAFGAHTAGAHLDVVGGTALYAWLLHLGGQPVIAQKLLTEANLRAPQQPLLAAVQQQLSADAPLATAALLQAPVRLAPYGSSVGKLSDLPVSARAVGTGVLAGQGRQVLLPANLLRKTSKIWVRNGLGQLSAAKQDKKKGNATLAVLLLHMPLPVEDALTLTASDAFPGSVAFVVEYAASTHAAPQWPALHTGFLGGLSNDADARHLGIALKPGPRGGPVFDDSGRLVGIAIARKGAADQIVLTSQLRPYLSDPLTPVAVATQKQKVSVDQIYESALRSTVQIIIAP
jgi:hypothetical protein